MPITINGTGSIAGLSAGGLPDGCVTAPDLDGAQTGAAPIYAARAWVNFNGTGTVAIRASGNVSSITDNGVGDYTVNFTTALADANYCMTHSVGDTSSNSADDDAGAHPFTKTSSSARVYVGYGNSTGNITFVDYNQIDLAFFR
jgi:hypothetical protein